MAEIVTGPKEEIAAFVNERQGYAPDSPWGYYEAIGLVRNGELVAGLIYNANEAANICVHIGAEEGSRWMTREFLHFAFYYPFVQLKKNRITALLRSGNKQAISFVENLGFKREGVLSNYYENGEARLVYGMLREECSYLDMRKAA